MLEVDTIRETHVNFCIFENLLSQFFVLYEFNRPPYHSDITVDLA